MSLLRLAQTAAIVSLTLLSKPVLADTGMPSLPLSSLPATVLPADYRIHPGDQVSVAVFGEPSLTSATPIKVLPDGSVTLPLAGTVTVGGLTTQQASAQVERKLSHYLREPHVALSVAAVAQYDVYILGNVKTPGKYVLDPDAHLLDAITAAGGLGPVDGPLPDARVSVGGVVSTISLEQMLHKGDLSLNSRVQNQMAIYIPVPPTFMVEVNGAVDHPGDVPMHDGDRLIVAIARAGTSPTVSADLNHVQVRHMSDNGVVSSQTINIYDIINKGQNDKDIVLQKGDVVYVPQGAAHHDSSGFFYALTSLFRL